MKAIFQTTVVSAAMCLLAVSPVLLPQPRLLAQAQPASRRQSPLVGPTAAVQQTIYVPVYSHIYFGTTAPGGRRRFPLTITLSIQNTDLHRPLMVTSARYYDQGGQFLQEYVPQPRRLAPLASIEIAIAERDEHGGVGANFIVEWRAEEAVSVPVVEALMSGIDMGLGVSFFSPGRVISQPPE